MTPPNWPSDEHINAFIDNELDSAEQTSLLEAIEQDEPLRNRVCETQGLKRLLQHAYQDMQPTSTPLRNRFGWRRIYGQYLIAASVLLLIGGSSGWMISVNQPADTPPKLARLINTIGNDNVAQEPDKILVQVSSANPVRLQSALDETEQLLTSYDATKRPLEMEILANGNGINLLVDGGSPFKARIEKMQAMYPNLHLYACQQTLEGLAARGIHVHLLPNTRMAGSALEEINRRVRQGWDFVRA